MKNGTIALIAAGCLLAVPMIAAVRADAHGEGPGMMDGGGPGMMGGWRHGPGAEHGYMSFLAGVKLTSAQRKQMHQIMKAAWSADRAEVEQLHALKSQIADAMASSGSVTEDSVGTLQQQAAQLGEKLDADRLTVAMQVRGLLTSDQLATGASTYAQLKALHEQEHALMEAGRVTAD